MCYLHKALLLKYDKHKTDMVFPNIPNDYDEPYMGIGYRRMRNIEEIQQQTDHCRQIDLQENFESPSGKVLGVCDSSERSDCSPIKVSRDNNSDNNIIPRNLADEIQQLQQTIQQLQQQQQQQPTINPITYVPHLTTNTNIKRPREQEEPDFHQGGSTWNRKLKQVPSQPSIANIYLFEGRPLSWQQRDAFFSILASLDKYNVDRSDYPMQIAINWNLFHTTACQKNSY